MEILKKASPTKDRKSVLGHMACRRKNARLIMKIKPTTLALPSESEVYRSTLTTAAITYR